MATKKKAGWPKGAKLIYVGEDDDNPELEAAGLDYWDAFGEAEEVFATEGIRTNRNEQIRFLVVLDEHVIGVATFEIRRSGFDEGAEYSFSAAVLSKYQKRGIGRKLVEAVIGEARDFARELGQANHFRVWVVNPNMAKLLESMGFETDGGEWTMDSPHMTMYL